MDVDEALAKARMAIGPNYYIEPAAKDYIQNYRLVQKNKKNSEEPIITKLKEPVGLKVKEESKTAGLKLNIKKTTTTTLRSWHLVPSLHGK